MVLPRFTLNDFPPEKKARQIAEELLLGHELIGLHGRHRITAVEFYVSGPDFCDEANHCHPLQLQSGLWYVHTAKNYQSLKAPRYSGIDLTCGNARQGIHAGILIRQLDGEGGGGLAIMKLLRGKKAKAGNLPAGDPRLKWTEREKQLLLRLQGSDAFSGAIHLQLLANPRISEIKAKKRIGISGKNFDHLLLHFAAK